MSVDSDKTESPSLDSLAQGLSEKDILWNSAGMHRPIASFWYNYIFILVAAIPAVLVIGYLIPSVIMPDPASLGMATIVTTFFQFLFTVFDVGTGLALERFVAEHAVKNPKRAIRYLQFFAWFQMTSGLIQVTIVAIYSIFMIREGQNAYLSWLFLIYSLIQYPGMLGVYKHALGAFQRHDKQVIVELFQNVVVQSVLQVTLVLVGRWIGLMNPMIGEGLGAAMGYLFGTYSTEFFGMLLSAKFFGQIIKPVGFRLLDTLRPEFDKDIVREVLIYGLKIVPAYAAEAGVSFLVLLMTISWMPSYTSIVAIVSLAKGVATITSISFTITPAISESYNNGYHNLTQYYIKQQWKHWSLIAMFLFVVVYLLVPPVFRTLAGEYSLAADILGILLITRLIIFPINFGSSVAQGINKPQYQTYALFFEQFTRAMGFFFFLNPKFGLIVLLGSSSALSLYIFADVPAYIVKLFAQWGFLKRDLKFSLAPSFYQTFVAPCLTAIPLFIVTWIPTKIFESAVAKSGGDLVVPIIIIAITLLVALFLFPMFILFPFYGLVGGWDDDGLEAFLKAARITGPSRFLVDRMAKFTQWGHNHSPMKNKFPIDFSKARTEADELSKLRIQIYLEGKNPDDVLK
jgi:O-antigen/teichoic acid export membrane protein